MKKIHSYTLLFLVLLTTQLQLHAQGAGWAKPFMDGASPLKVTTDKDGNVYSVGTFTYSDFDPGPGTYTMTSAYGAYDLFISKLDSSGQFVWAKQIGGPSYTTPSDIKTDDQGNIYLAYTFEDTLDTDPGPSTYYISSESFYSTCILKLTSSGNFIWAKELTGNGYCYPVSIAVDTLHNVYTSGGVSGQNVDLDPGSGTYAVSTPSYYVQPNYTYIDYKWNTYISKLDPNGNFIFALTHSVSPGSISVNQAQEIVMFVSADPSGYNSHDNQVVAYDKNGSIKWLKDIPGQNEMGTIDKVNNVYVTGIFYGSTFDFDPGPGTYTIDPSPDGFSVSTFVLKLDSSGNFKWAQKVDKLYGPNQIISDASDNIYMTGQYGGGLNIYFDVNSPNQDNILNSARGRGYIWSIGSNGSFRWVKQVGQGPDPYGGLRPNSLAMDGFGNIYTVGSFDGTLDFDCGPVINTLTATTSTDGYIHKLHGALYITGIEEQTEAIKMSLFPNPTNSLVYFTYNRHLEHANLRIVDVNGKVMQESKGISTATYTIDISALPNGVYIVELLETKAITHGKLIKD